VHRSALHRVRDTLVLCLMLWTIPSMAADAPRRIVSFNQCADQLVLALADPGQIVGLSPYAADPSLSVMAEAAKQYRRVDWQAESIIPLQPDLVMVGAWDRPVTRRMLMALGYRLAEVETVSGIAAARAQITRVAELVGHPERGEQLVRALDAARARLAARGRPPLTTALVVERGGFSAGSATIAAALLNEVGLRPPPGAPAGIGGFVSLERLLVLKPDVVVLKDPPAEATDQGALYLTHPALRGAYPPNRQIHLPTRYSMCGGPALIEALDYLGEAIGRLSR
jgi:iron complex transport system substrate-binding protein